MLEGFSDRTVRKVKEKSRKETSKRSEKQPKANTCTSQCKKKQNKKTRQNCSDLNRLAEIRGDQEELNHIAVYCINILKIRAISS